jgi:O-antigen ligase
VTAGGRPWWAALVAGSCVAAGVVLEAAPLVAVGVAGAALAATVFAVWPYAVLLMLLLLRPSLDASGTLVSVGDTNAAGAVGLVTATAGTLALLARSRHLRGRVVAFPLIGFVLLSFASVTYSLDPGRAVRVAIGFAGMAVVFLMAAWTVREVRHLNRLVAVLLVSGIVPISVGLVQLLTGETIDKSGFGAIPATFVHPNGFAFFLAVVIPLAVVAMLEARRKGTQLLLGVYIALALVCLISTYARSAWIAAALVVALLAAAHYRRLLLGLALTSVLVLAFAPAAVDLVEKRFGDLSASSASYSTNSFSWRVENWSRMMRFAQARPLRGNGLASYEGLSLQEFGAYDHDFVITGRTPNDEDGPDSGVVAHNDYVKLAVELGAAGVALWTAVFFGLALLAWRARRLAGVRPYALVTFGIVCMLAVLSAVDNIQTNVAVMWVLMAMAGAMAGLAEHARRRDDQRRRLTNGLSR